MKLTMPSKQSSTLLVPNPQNEVRAVTDLVSEIKENLRITNLKSKSSLKPGPRRTPYHIPCRSWNEDAATMKSKQKHEEDTSDDPYELLQALIKNNSLVKEAVRRLQHGLTSKQRYFYESEEDTMSPVLRICHLELCEN